MHAGKPPPSDARGGFSVRVLARLRLFSRRSISLLLDLSLANIAFDIADASGTGVIVFEMSRVLTPS